jgi:aminoglycoside phosphotransferase (APT) family kinase protein
MQREWRILEALHRHAPAVPVPAPLAWCGDEGVTGAPFYAMAFVEGTILRGAADTTSWAPADFARATGSLVETQVALHALDVDAVGLGDLARERTGYVARQLRRWRKQAEASKTREVPLLYELHDRLQRALPPEPGPPALVHGDYRFDNTVLGADRRVIAVFDWELATIGDPVADFCWSLLYWSDPGDRVHALSDPPTLAPGFPRRAEVAALYARRSGRDLSHLDTYFAFSWWKQACIVEGVLARVKQGATGGMRVSSPGEIAARVDLYLALADDLSRGR